jgi:DNA-directed RNA polymerase subunit F
MKMGIKHIFENIKRIFVKVKLKYHHLVEFIRLDPAEIRRLVEKTPLAVSA